MGLFSSSGKRAKRKAAGKAKVTKGGTPALYRRRARKTAKNKRQGRF